MFENYIYKKVHEISIYIYSANYTNECPMFFYRTMASYLMAQGV